MTWLADQRLLRARLTALLIQVPSILYTDVCIALKAPGKLLAIAEDEEAAKSWPLLTFFIAHHVRPDVSAQVASQAAVAIEYLVSALDLLDDVEDEDQSDVVASIGVARTLNVSTALLTMARSLIASSTEEGLARSFAEQMQVSFDQYLLQAIVGQHRDLLAEDQDIASVSYEDAIMIARGKGGSLMRLACLMGVQCAQGGKEWAELYGELGELLGTAYQIENDCHDIQALIEQHSLQDPKDIPSKSDLTRKKKTLPIVLALQALRGEKSEEKLFTDPRAVREGLMGAWGVYLLYREKAFACLQKLEQFRPATSELHRLLGWD